MLSRKDFRHETQMKAELGEEKIPAEVLNVSKEGLLVRIDTNFPNYGDRTVINVWLNHTTSTLLTVEARWCPKNGLLGLQILKSTDEWQFMIETLELGYSKQAA